MCGGGGLQSLFFEISLLSITKQCVVYCGQVEGLHSKIHLGELEMEAGWRWLANTSSKTGIHTRR